MCTNFEISALTVLRQLNSGPKTEDDLYRHFGEDVFRLSLGGATLGEFLESLAEEGYVEPINEKFSLTTKGTLELAHLEKIVAQAQECADSN